MPMKSTAKHTEIRFRLPTQAVANAAVQARPQASVIKTANTKPAACRPPIRTSATAPKESVVVSAASSATVTSSSPSIASLPVTSKRTPG